MKKLLVAMISLLAVSNAFGFFGGRCGGCKPAKCETSVTCEEKPVCYKMVRKELAPRKVCETTCHYVCPPETVREDASGEQ